MSKNNDMRISLFLVLLLLANFIPSYVKAMEQQRISKDEEAKIRAQFYLGEMCVLGEGGEVDYEEAREYFEEVIDKKIDKEACAWSYLWLSKFRLDDGEEAEEYLVKARSYGKDVAFICELVDILKEYSDGKLEKEKSKEIFMDVVKKGSKRALGFLLACGVQVDLSDYLHCAAQYGHKGIVELLLEKGADIEVQDKSGYTALFLAAKEGHEEIVDLLLEREACGELIDGNGKTLFEFMPDLYKKNLFGAMQTRFNLGERFAFGKDCDKSYEKARECFNKVIEINIDKDLCAWSYLWLAAIRLNEVGHTNDIHKEAKNYISKAVVFFKNYFYSSNKNFSINLIGRYLNGRINRELEKRDCDRTFFEAVERGSLRCLKFLLDFEGKTQLFVRCDKSLINSISTFGGMKAIHIVAKKGHKELLEYLLEKKADIEVKSANGFTALHWAACGGHEDIIELLLENGAVIDAQDNLGRSSLHCASSQGHANVVALLLEKGLAIETKIMNGMTALHLAAESGYKAVVEVLLENGADIDAQDDEVGFTALHWATLWGFKDIVESLLDRGADREAQDSLGKTALHLADSKDVVDLLLKKGSAIGAKDKYSLTALHHAAYGRCQQDMCFLLLEKGFDFPELYDDYGLMSLHCANRKDFNVIAAHLLKRGAEIEAKDKDGRTGLHWAAYGGSIDCVTLLLESGADIKAKNVHGKVALHCAASEGHKEVVVLLLEKGADINVKDKDGKTALHWAANCGHNGVVELLLKMGADCEVKDKDGKTPLDYMPALK